MPLGAMHAGPVIPIKDDRGKGLPVKALPVKTSPILAVCLLAGVVGSWVSLGASPARAAEEVALYVSPSGDDANPGTESAPFLTIDRVQQAVRAAAGTMTSDIVVYLRQGTYELREPLRFDHRDSGQHGFSVSYRSAPGEQAIISGGRVLSGWSPEEHGQYSARTDGRRFRQLYVDGRRSLRARTPNHPDFARLIRWDETNRTIVIPVEFLPGWRDLFPLEMVILKQWTQDNVRLAATAETSEGVVVIPREPDRTKTFVGHLALRYEQESFFLENARSFLDAPGEWYADAADDRVYYLPRSGEDLRRAQVVVPVLEQLVELQGTPRDPVHHLTFQGLHFEYAGWLLPSEEGFATLQADVTYTGGVDPRTGRVAAAVTIEHAHDVVLARNTFRRLGATALMLQAGVSDLRIVGNRFEDLSGSGVVVDGRLHPRPIDPRWRCERIFIANNRIERIGVDYRSSVGIFAGYVADVTIEHNEIVDAPYTGISVGWGWTEAETMLRGNRIQWNHIHGVMTTMADGAGIYTLSRQPGTLIRGNYIHDLSRSPWAGYSPIAAIYLDEGSEAMDIVENVVERVPLGLFLHHASHNRIVNTEGTYEERNGATDNVFVTHPGFLAETIKAGAGPEPAYADLRAIP